MAVDEQDGGRHEWAAPESIPWTAGSPARASTPAGADADGPPPPPWERRRTQRRARRRRVVAIVAVVALVLVVPLALTWAGVFDRPDGDAGASGSEAIPTDPSPGPTPPDPSPGPTPPDPSPGPAPDTELTPPDPADFSGSDADFARLLTGVEGSERAMLQFQQELGAAYGLVQGDDLAPFFAAVRGAAEDGAQRLSEARDALERPLETDAADTVRQVYLDHLDAWLAYMEAVAIDPTLAGPEGESGRYDVEINATAVDFSRALEAELPDDAAEPIVDFAEALLDRGFRFEGQAEV